MGAYLMVYHKDDTHSLHMAVSYDGRTFTAVNGNEPVIAGDTIALQRGIRDPHIFRGPDGAFYLFIKAPGGDAQAFSHKAKAKDLLLVPGDGFGCPGYFRICYCVSYDMIQRSLPVFRALIQENG